MPRLRTSDIATLGTARRGRRPSGPGADVPRLRSLVLAVLTAGAGLATVGAGPAAAACTSASKPAGMKVALWERSDCTGSPANIGRSGEDDVPDFTRFPHTERVVDVNDDRSSLAVGQGYCVRLFDFKSYGGEASSLFCGAVTKPAAYKLGSLGDRVTSMRTCPADTRNLCNAKLPPTTTTPTDPTTPQPPENPDEFPPEDFPPPSDLPPELPPEEGPSEPAPLDPLRFDKASKRCSKGSTTGARALRAWMLETGIARRSTPTIYRCGKRRDLHSSGRAVDFPARSQDAAQQLIALLSADEFALARRMGVQEIISDGTFWSAAKPSPNLRRYRGKSPHRRSVHVGLNKQGAALRTSYWTDGPAAIASGESPAPSAGDFPAPAPGDFPPPPS